MDGKTLDKELHELLSEGSSSQWMTPHTTYNYLYEAAIATQKRLKLSKGTQTITTVLHQAAYGLNPDFMELYLKDDSNNHFIRYYSSALGTSEQLIYWTPYQAVVRSNSQNYTAIPDNFSIIDQDSIDQLTGSATSDGAVVAQECTLTDAGADFTSVAVGDIVHNVDDGTDGIVVFITSTTALITALFDESNGSVSTNGWTSGDSYVINPQSRLSLVIDPAPDAATYTITIDYIKKPAPVYSWYRRYNFPAYVKSLPKYAAWLYKYRDTEPNFGDTLFKAWDLETREATNQLDYGMKRTGFRVNFIKKSNTFGSFR